jgi:PP-loop superfamily ATP-utilizing enzyme
MAIAVSMTIVMLIYTFVKFMTVRTEAVVLFSGGIDSTPGAKVGREICRGTASIESTGLYSPKAKNQQFRLESRPLASDSEHI